MLGVVGFAVVTTTGNLPEVGIVTVAEPLPNVLASTIPVIIPEAKSLNRSSTSNSADGVGIACKTKL